jgi:hypothetical protein
MQTVKPLVPEPSFYCGLKLLLKSGKHESPGTDQIPSELIQAGVKHYVLTSTNSFSFE